MVCVLHQNCITQHHHRDLVVPPLPAFIVTYAYALWKSALWLLKPAALGTCSPPYSLRQQQKPLPWHMCYVGGERQFLSCPGPTTSRGLFPASLLASNHNRFNAWVIGRLHCHQHQAFLLYWSIGTMYAPYVRVCCVVASSQHSHRVLLSSLLS